MLFAFIIVYINQWWMNDEAVRIVLFEPASPSEIPTSQVILQSV